MTSRPVWALGALATALGASLCCILPLSVALLGVGSAALGAWLEPWRPFFVALTVGFLGYAYYRTYRQEPTCTPGDACNDGGDRRRPPIWLWLVTVLSLALVTFPYYVSWLF